MDYRRDLNATANKPGFPRRAQTNLKRLFRTGNTIVKPREHRASSAAEEAIELREFDRTVFTRQRRRSRDLRRDNPYSGYQT